MTDGKPDANGGDAACGEMAAGAAGAAGAAHRGAYVAGQIIQGLLLGSGLFLAVLKILGAVGKGALFRYQGF